MAQFLLSIWMFMNAAILCTQRLPQGLEARPKRIAVMPRDPSGAYQCAELDPVPKVCAPLGSGISSAEPLSSSESGTTMTQLWSVEAPARPARQT